MSEEQEEEEEEEEERFLDPMRIALWPNRLLGSDPWAVPESQEKRKEERGGVREKESKMNQRE